MRRVAVAGGGLARRTLPYVQVSPVSYAPKSNACAMLVGVWLIIDGERYELSDAYVDIDAERKRIAQALFRCEVEQVHLADGRRVLVNWRSVRFVSVEQ